MRFAEGSVITVYIPPDPHGLNRVPSLTDRILSWNGERPLISHNIKIQVTTTPPAKETPIVVNVNWVANIPNTTELGQGGPEYDNSSGKDVSDDSEIDLTHNPNDVDNQMAKNLGIHEMGQVLGLDDTPGGGDAMNQKFTKNSHLSIKDGDMLELFSTFAHTFAATINPTVTPDGSLFRYTYTLDWKSGD